jgi:hypothetical protein
VGGCLGDRKLSAQRGYQRDHKPTRLVRVATSGGSVNHSDVASLVVGGLLILMVGVLLLGLGWTTYALFVLGAISVTTLASGGHVEVVIALGLILVGGGVLLTGNSRAYLGFETNQIDTHPGIARDEP